jgi:hypothetical protein
MLIAASWMVAAIKCGQLRGGCHMVPCRTASPCVPHASLNVAWPELDVLLAPLLLLQRCWQQQPLSQPRHLHAVCGRLELTGTCGHGLAGTALRSLGPCPHCEGWSQGGFLSHLSLQGYLAKSLCRGSPGWVAGWGGDYAWLRERHNGCRE